MATASEDARMTGGYLPNFPAIGILGLALAVAGAAMTVKAPEIEAGIAAEAGEALDGLGLEAFVDGRDVTLTGIARDEDHRDMALIRLAAIDGVDKLTNHTSIAAPPSPYVLTMTRTAAGEVYLEGHLPDDALRQRLWAVLASSGEVMDYTALAPGPAGDWAARAESLAGALATLSAGRAVLADDAVSVTGIYAEERREEAFAVLNQPGWRVSVESDPRAAVDRLRSEETRLRTVLRNTWHANDMLLEDRTRLREVNAELVSRLQALGVDGVPGEGSIE